MKITRFVACGLAVAAMAWLGAQTAYAGTVYVDNKLSDYAGHDGSSWQMAYKTIQEGVNAAADGDTVLVASGTYGDDQGKVAAGSGYHACRVYIDKAITLKSSDGRDKTHIVGKYVEGTANSADAVGGVVIAKAAAVGTVVQGFTIRGCGTSIRSGGSNPVGGAAVYCNLDAATAMAGMPWVADCAIDDCYSYRCAVKYVNVARTIITHCWGPNLPTVSDYCNLAWCVVAHNGDQGVDVHLLRGTKTDGATANYVINCTIQDNARNGTSTSAPRYFLNSIFWQGGVYSPMLANSVFSNGRGGMGNSSNPVDPSSTNATATSVFSKGDGVTAGPAANDFRLVRGTTLANATVSDSPALNLGSSSHLELLPEAYRWKDCYGNAVTPVNGKIHAGAVQETMTPVAGVTINGNTRWLSVNDIHGVQSLTQTLYTDVWPVCYDMRGDDAATLTAASQPPFFGYLVQDSTVPNRILFPDSNERLPFVPEKGRRIKLTPYLATHVRYVDAAAEDGNANTGSGTAVDPYSRIQQALDSVPNSANNLAVIYVAPGTYSAGKTIHSGLHCNSRVHVSNGETRYRVIATGGAENTVITGEADAQAPAAWQGCSTNAVRCIRADDACSVAFQGFTLTGGHTAGGEDGIGSGNSYARGGAMLATNSERCWLVECIVTNNVAYWGGGAFANGVAVKSYFADNRVVKGGGVFSPQNNSNKGREILSSCVVDQKGLLFDAVNGVMVVNCTLRATSSTKILSGADGDVFNSILVDSAASTASDASKRMMGNVIWNYNYNGAAAGNTADVNYVKADPLFVDAAGGDFRVCSGSPAVGGGAAWDGLDASVWSETVAYSNYYRHIYCDMDGNMPYFVNGKPTAGAYQVPGKASVTVTAQGASISATSSGAVDWGTEVSVTAADGARQVLGLSVNGEVLEGETSYTFTTSLDDYANGYTVKVVVNTNWYVDAANGTSGATGWSADAALDTLEHVMAKAESGDTVYALPGNYNTGSMMHTNLVYSLWYSKTNATVQLPSRVVVPAGVRLISTAGAEQTFITGVKAATSTGYGEGAMRCVMMQKGAYLNGFTVTGGGTLAGETAYQYEVFDNVSGGGILCAERPGAPGPGLAPVPVTVVENCIISNNCGQGTSAAIFGSYVHCLFVKNGSGGGNCLVREPQWLYGCVADDNIVDMIAVYQPYYADFCTFGANNRGADGTPKAALQTYPSTAFWPVRNCLFLGGANCQVKWAYGCVVPSSSFFSQNTSNGEPTREGVVVGTVAVDADWRPTAFDTAAVDAAVDPMTAENACFQYAIPSLLLRETDFAGGQRVYNGVQDVGAGEFDWRPRYWQDIGGGLRRAVTAAGPDATEAAHGVQLADGATLTATWTLHGPSNKCEYAVAFTGEGTLYLAVNGGEETAVDATGGTQTLRLPSGANTLAFRYAGTGTATLSDFVDFAGTMLLFR